MLKRTVVILTAAALFGGAVPTQFAQARDYYDDDMWDLMNPSWWYDEMFEDDDDDWYYRRHRYSPYWGSPYGWRPPVYVIQQQPVTNKQYSEIRPPE